MAIKVPLGGCKRRVDIVNTYVRSFCKIGLYKNNHTPTNTDGMSAFVETDFGGYSRQSIGSFQATTDDGHGRALGVCDVVNTFTKGPSGANNDVYGYFIVDETGGTDYLMWAERFADAPYRMELEGTIIDVRVRHTSITEF